MVFCSCGTQEMVNVQESLVRGTVHRLPNFPCYETVQTELGPTTRPVPNQVNLPDGKSSSGYDFFRGNSVKVRDLNPTQIPDGSQVDWFTTIVDGPPAPATQIGPELPLAVFDDILAPFKALRDQWMRDSEEHREARDQCDKEENPGFWKSCHIRYVDYERRAKDLQVRIDLLEHKYGKMEKG